jgi:hypothetical protein
MILSDEEEILRMCEEMAERDKHLSNDAAEVLGTNNDKVLTVSQAIRRNSGEGIVRGMIVSCGN